MKKHHILLLVGLAVIASCLLVQTFKLHQAESISQEELRLLRQAVKNPPGNATTTSTGRSAKDRAPVIDTAAILSRLNVDPSSEGFRQTKLEFFHEFEPKMMKAPLSKLKELCADIEKDYPLADNKNALARDVWMGILALASKSDPAWAMEKVTENLTVLKSQQTDALEIFKRWSTLHEGFMSPSYAGALEKWLTKAQAEGVVAADHPLVAELGSTIAVAKGDASAAVKQIAQLSHGAQDRAVEQYLGALQTPGERQQALEELSSVLYPQKFGEFAAKIGRQQGFDAARDILINASLTPESFDLAAAAIAGAQIGQETSLRAEWLLENLRSDNLRAISEFAEKWTDGNYVDAAAWISKLRKGNQRDAALKGFIPAAARIDGASAMDWALTVSDPILRNRMYGEAHAKWEETDAGQANEYRKTHQLDREALEAAGN
jgi:hypothetical protein